MSGKVTSQIGIIYLFIKITQLTLSWEIKVTGKNLEHKKINSITYSKVNNLKFNKSSAQEFSQASVKHTMYPLVA